MLHLLREMGRGGEEGRRITPTVDADPTVDVESLGDYLSYHLQLEADNFGTYITSEKPSIGTRTAWK